MGRQESGFPEAGSEERDASLTVHELPEEMRPREVVLRRGAEAVCDEVLVAILLRSGTQGKNVTELAREVLRRANGLAELAKMSFEELLSLRIKGLGKVKALELAAALELGRRAAAPAGAAPQVLGPEEAFRILEPCARRLRQEVFWVLMLDVKSRLIGPPVEASRGLIDSSPVHPREVFSKAIRCNAVSVLLAHNHPSGDPTPSREDVTITRRLVDAARILGIKVVDHVVVGRVSETSRGYVSLRERGLVSFD